MTDYRWQLRPRPSRSRAILGWFLLITFLYLLGSLVVYAAAPLFTGAVR